MTTPDERMAGGPARKAPSDALVMFTIYQNPSDYPGQFVVRRATIRGTGLATRTDVDPSPHAIVHSLEAARAAVPAGFVRTPRHPDDDPVIVEVWL